jgi:hypothetical protein
LNECEDFFGAGNCSLNGVVVRSELKKIVGAKENLIEDYKKLSDFVG